MPNFTMVEVKERPYLYTERSCTMDPADMNQNMGIAFGKVAEFVGRHGITSVQHALSVYYSHDEHMMTFRAGFLVSAEDAAKAKGDIKADVTPAGTALNCIHKGSYATLRICYGEMMQYMEENGLEMGVPTWEVYIKDMDTVASEDDLETDIYVTVSNT